MTSCFGSEVAQIWAASFGGRGIAELYDAIIRATDTETALRRDDPLLT